MTKQDFDNYKNLINLYTNNDELIAKSKEIIALLNNSYVAIKIFNIELNDAYSKELRKDIIEAMQKYVINLQMRQENL